MARHIPYEENHREIEGILEKKCSIHSIYCPEDESPWFPCTTEYYYKSNMNSIDGLHTWCKECSRKKALEQKINKPEYYKQKDKERYDRDKDYRKKLNQKFNLLNPGRKNEIREAYIKKHPEKQTEYRLRREPKNHKISKKEWNDCQKYFDYKCAYCGLPLTEHWVTYKGIIKLGNFHKEHNNDKGANDLSNCVPSCESCNCKKWSFDFEEWYRSYPHFSQERYNKIIKWLSEDYKQYIVEKKIPKVYTYNKQIERSKYGL